MFYWSGLKQLLIGVLLVKNPSNLCYTLRSYLKFYKYLILPVEEFSLTKLIKYFTGIF